MIIENDLFLEHYGKKGMKLGQRKAARSVNRSLNKASRQKDRDAYNKSIDSARARVGDGSKANAAFKKNKAQYKIDKQNIGSREARKILAKKNDKIMTDIVISQSAKTGKETTKAVAAVVGLTLITALARGASA